MAPQAPKIWKYAGNRRRRRLKFYKLVQNTLQNSLKYLGFMNLEIPNFEMEILEKILNLKRLKKGMVRGGPTMMEVYQVSPFTYPYWIL